MSSANRTARITARYRERERQLIEAAARATGVHISEYVRDAALARARRGLAELAETIPSRANDSEHDSGR